MSPKFLERQSTRREMLRNSAAFAGSALLAQLFPANLLTPAFLILGSKRQRLQLTIWRRCGRRWVVRPSNHNRWRTS